MAYIINKTNGDPLVTVDDGTADVTTTTLALIGRNFPGYGEYINENFVKLLENFSRNTQPNTAQSLKGQLWYDTSVSPGVLKVYNGTAYVAAGSSIDLEQTSANMHYMTMVASEIGAPALKTAKDKGLTIQPSTGNIGINTTQVPVTKLVLNADSNRSRALPGRAYPGTVAQIYGADGQDCIITIDSFSGTNGVLTGGFWFRKARGTSGAPTTVQQYDFLGGMAAGGYAFSDYTTTARAAMWFQTSQTWTDADNGTRISFYTTPNNSNSWRESLAIEANGDIKANYGDVIAYAASDERMKSNIEKIPSALSKVLSLDGVTFNWRENIDGKDSTQREPGVIAQQVQQVLPEAVKQRDDGNLAVRYEKLIPLLIEAIKDLQAEVADLKKFA